MAEIQKKEAAKEFPKWKEWFFGAGTFGFTMCNSVMNTFYYYFLTNIVMMSPALMALITTISRIATLFYAPIKGVIITNKEWKGGKYNTYLRWFEPITRVLMVLCFINFQASAGMQFLYYAGIFMVASFFGTFVDTAALTSLRLITKDPQQSVRISSKRSVTATAGQVLYSLITVSLVAGLGKGDMGKGYLMVYILYSLFAIIGYQLTANICIKDYDLYKVSEINDGQTAVAKQAAPEKIKYPISVYLNAYLKNPSPLVLLLGDACKGAASLLYSGAITYYLTCYVGNVGALTTFLFTANMAMLLGSYLTPVFVKLIGRKATNILAYGGFGTFLILGYFIGVGQAWGITLCVGIGRFFSGLNASIIGSLYMDIGDDYENRTGYNLTSFFVSIGGLSWSLASVFVGTIVGTTLAKVGYSATAVVTQPMLDAMLRLVTLIPGIPLAIGTVLFALFYNLTDKRMETVHRELDAKRQAAGK